MNNRGKWYIKVDSNYQLLSRTELVSLLRAQRAHESAWC